MKTYIIKDKLAILFVLVAVSCLMSCKKFLEIDSPKDAARSTEVFQNDAIATSAVIGIYSNMAAFGSYSGDQNSVSSLAGLTADELKSHTTTLDDFFINQIPTSNSSINTLWSNSYKYIYTANAILEGIQKPNGLTEGAKMQLQGEAMFTRAFMYFYLVNLFGEVPLDLTTDYRVNQIAPKSSRDAVYTQIISDLSAAETLLSEKYVTVERTRPTKWAAIALLARVYLFTEKWQLAADKATEVIDQKGIYTLVDDLDKVFAKNSTEAIWQLMPSAGTNAPEGALYILTSTPTAVSLSDSFLSSFESDDNRRTKWIGQSTNSTGNYFFPYKYKVKTTVNGVITEYSMVLRLAEMFLVRSEARAKLDQPALSLGDLNIIRKRAGLTTPLSGLTSADCLIEVAKQRKVELFCEWGHRWLDLKRTNKSSLVLAGVKGSTWANTDILFPIPDNEINRNPSLSQNPGY